MGNIIPLFKSIGSIGRSILTVDDEILIKEESSISILAIANKYKLDKIFVIDDSFIQFPNLYKYCDKYNIQLIFGISFVICNNPLQKDEKSLFSNHRVSVVMSNSDGYKDLIKIHNAINSNKDNFYYECRGSLDILKNLWTDNLQLFIPPYNNFLEKNLIYNGTCIPDFGNIKPIMLYSNMEIPYDQMLVPAINNYSKNNNYECEEVHPVYYYRNSDFKVFDVYRCINNRSKFTAPNINYLCSDNFSWEKYCTKTDIKFLN